MNNLTEVILNKSYNFDIEEWSKQGNSLQFDSGLEQNITGGSIPAISLRILYRGLTFEDYELLRAAYESNHSNTFIVNLNDDIIDKRYDFLTENGSVWAFNEFKFKIDAKENFYKGEISLKTSVFFNFSAYQDLFSQESTYAISTSTNQEFIDLLDDCAPYSVDFSYSNNAISSSIGESVRHMKNKGGLKKVWTLYWLLNESQFLQLITMYRKKAGIMGTFGMPTMGYNMENFAEYLEADYLEDQDDYIIFYQDLDNVLLARFVEDSIKYQKRVDGFFQIQADFIEVKQ